jgi:hypothetical protein
MVLIKIAVWLGLASTLSEHVSDLNQQKALALKKNIYFVK